MLKQRASGRSVGRRGRRGGCSADASGRVSAAGCATLPAARVEATTPAVLRPRPPASQLPLRHELTRPRRRVEHRLHRLARRRADARVRLHAPQLVWRPVPRCTGLSVVTRGMDASRVTTLARATTARTPAAGYGTLPRAPPPRHALVCDDTKSRCDCSDRRNSRLPAAATCFIVSSTLILVSRSCSASRRRSARGYAVVRTCVFGGDHDGCRAAPGMAPRRRSHLPACSRGAC